METKYTVGDKADAQEPLQGTNQLYARIAIRPASHDCFRVQIAQKYSRPQKREQLKEEIATRSKERTTAAAQKTGAEDVLPAHAHPDAQIPLAERGGDLGRLAPHPAARHTGRPIGQTEFRSRGQASRLWGGPGWREQPGADVSSAVLSAGRPRTSPRNRHLRRRPKQVRLGRHRAPDPGVRARGGRCRIRRRIESSRALSARSCYSRRRIIHNGRGTR